MSSVNGSQVIRAGLLALSIGALACRGTESRPGGSGPVNPSSLPAMQFHLGGVEWAFADVLHSAEAWIAVDPKPDAAGAQALASSLQTDASGWPLSLPAGVSLQLLGGLGYGTGQQNDPTSGELRDTYLYGVWVLTWKGKGQVEFSTSQNDGLDQKALLESPNRIVYLISTPFKHPYVSVSSTDPTDPVRDMHLWAPVYDGAGLTLTESSDLNPGSSDLAGQSLEPAPGQVAPMFHPVYLANIAENPTVGVIRYMSWLEINGLPEDSPPATWDDRRGGDSGVGWLKVVDQEWNRYTVTSYKQRLGFPYEWAVALSNATGKDLWIQVPHTADDDLVRGLAGLVAGSLDPNLRVWIEFSNELWNGASAYLPQYHHAARVAAAHFGVDPASVSTEQQAWGSGNVQGHFLQTFRDEWRRLGQSDDRLIQVVAGFVASSSYCQAVLDAVKEVGSDLPEVLAVTTYFGYGTQGDIFALYDPAQNPSGWGVHPDVWPADFHDKTAEIVRRNLYETYDSWVAAAKVAAEAGIPLVAYEGGQHLLPLGYGDWDNPAHADFMHYMYSFQRSQQMHDLYLEHWALWSAAGGRTASLFTDFGIWSFWGYWGAKEYITQTRQTSAKWRAFCEWGEKQSGVRAPSEPLGSRPVVTIPVLRGEENVPFSADLSATGGDGTVTFSVLGGSLPPGITLQQIGSGAARLEGTPSLNGTYRFVLRAIDADGDPNDQLLVFEVDPAGLSQNALFVFRGSDAPATPPHNDPNGGNGRYDPVRDYYREGNLFCIPFSLTEPLFGQESDADGHIDATSQLNMYGGWCANTAEDNAWVGLRHGRFEAWVGDTTGPSSLDLALLWRQDQFTPFSTTGPYSFGAGPDDAALQIDLTALSSDGANELRWVIVNHEGGNDVWYLSEAVWTSQHLDDGYWLLQNFSGASDAGKRWASITPPSDHDISMPDAAGLTFAAKAFDDVRAVGILYHGTRSQWNFLFGFDRVFALGTRQ